MIGVIGAEKENMRILLTLIYSSRSGEVTVIIIRGFKFFMRIVCTFKTVLGNKKIYFPVIIIKILNKDIKAQDLEKKNWNG